jgi:uncharacterized protein (TIGR03435 family)
MTKAAATIGILLGIARGFAQPAQPGFEAATVKPTKIGTDSSSWNSRPGYIVMKNQSLKALVRIAYGVRDDQISGGPKWFDTDHFDIEARASGPAGDPELLAMMQALLTERFQLGFHRGTKPITAYSLVVAKGGLKIHPDESGNRQRWNSHRGKIDAQCVSMAKLAESLSGPAGGPVVDATGIKAVFTFTLEWTPEPPRVSAGPDGAAPPDPLGTSDLFSVVQQQLGLRLEPRKSTVETLVIDRAEKPAEN